MPPLDQQRERIQDDIRGLMAGEVRCDDVFLQLFASDASIYEMKPLGVVRPRSAADVAACVRYAAEKHIPIHARGAGTGRGGRVAGAGADSRLLGPSAPRDPRRSRAGPGAAGRGLRAAERDLAAAGPRARTGPRQRPGYHGRKHDRHRRRRQPLAEIRLDAAARAEPSSRVGRRSRCWKSAARRWPTAPSTSTIPRKRDLVNRLAALLGRERRTDPPASAEHSAEPLRIRPGRHPRRRAHRPRPAAGRLGRDAGADYRGDAAHRAAAAASRGRRDLVRQRGEGRPRRPRRGRQQSHRPAI